MRIDVWSDIACPWCYVGKRRLEVALYRWVKTHAERPQVVWRSFELDPMGARAEDGASYAERLARKYDRSTREAEGMIARMTDVGRAAGVEFRFDKARFVGTFDAHRLSHLAAVHGVQDVVQEALFKAHFTDGRDVSAVEDLTSIGVEAGLNADDVRGALAGDDHSADVRADEAQAVRLGIRGVPFFVIDGRYGVSGAQPPEVLLQALEEVARESEGQAASEGAACGPDGCG